MLTELRPSTVSEFIDWLRNAIRQLEEIESLERDLSHYDDTAMIVADAERHARFVGAIWRQDVSKACFRLSSDDGPLLSPREGLAILGECLAWCIERASALAATEAQPLPALLTVNDVARLVQQSPSHIRRLADSGRMPRPIKSGASVRWDRNQIDNWIQNGCKPVRKKGLA